MFEKFFASRSLKALRDAYNKHRDKEKHGAFCWAPFTSLRFHRNGSVQVCCHHIEYYSLESSTLKDIWFGAELELLRKQMRQFKPPVSCNFCASHFLNGDFSNVNALSFDKYQVSDNAFPVFMDFSLDNTCNLSCIMCDASLSSSIQRKKNIDFRNTHIYNQDFVEQLHDFIPHLKGSMFTGGEPFLIDIYYDLWELMLRLNPDMDIHITTNGTIYNDKVADVLSKNRFNITVSIDSFEKEVYEKIRVGAHFEKTLENIELFSEYCTRKGTQFTITVCPMTLNVKEIPSIVEKCNKNNWNFTYNIVLKPWSLALWALKTEELDIIITYYDSFSLEKPLNELQQSNLEKLKNFKDLLHAWRQKLSRLHTSNVDAVAEKLYNNKQALSNYLNDLLKSSSKLNLEETVNVVLEKLPLMVFEDEVLKVFFKMDKSLIINEFLYNDTDTIADHFITVAVSILMMRKA